MREVPEESMSIDFSSIVNSNEWIYTAIHVFILIGIIVNKNESTQLLCEKIQLFLLNSSIVIEVENLLKLCVLNLFYSILGYTRFDVLTYIWSAETI